MAIARLHTIAMVERYKQTIAGQLAGALYGASGIPGEWLEKLAWSKEIGAAAEALIQSRA